MLTGKERLIVSMDHEEADRIPVDFCGTPSSGIHIEAYSRLLKHLNIFDIPKVFDLLQFLALPNEDIIKYFKSDVILLPRLCPRFGIQIDEYKPYITQKGTLCQVPKGFEPVISDESVNILDDDGNILAKMPNGGLYFDFVYAEHARIENSDHADQASFSVFTDHEISYLKNKALENSSKTDKDKVGAFV